MLRFKSDLPLVYMDVSIKGWGVGRIEMVLFKDSAPMAAENFRALCTGGWEVVVEPQWWADVFCSGCVKAERQSQSPLRTHARVRLSAVHGMPALICSSASLACPAACAGEKGLVPKGHKGAGKAYSFKVGHMQAGGVHAEGQQLSRFWRYWRPHAPGTLWQGTNSALLAAFGSCRCTFRAPARTSRRCKKA